MSKPWRHVAGNVSNQQFAQDKAKCAVMGDLAPGGEIAYLLVFTDCLRASGYEPVDSSPAPEKDPIIEAKAAYDRHDYTTTVRLLSPMAARGDATAEYLLGVMYASGEGVPQDWSEAVKWCRAAANQGLAQAQASLGLLYELGQGVPQNDTEAAKLYRQAAEQGDGNGQYGIGRMLLDGEGVSRDYVQAYKWLTLAMSGAPSSDTRLREAAIERRNKASAKMTPSQIAEAERLAANWAPR